MSRFLISKVVLATAVLGGCWLPVARAQSSVTIYGILESGVTHVNNANGGTQTLMDTGIMQGSRLGYRSVEDLGGGLSAIFVLEQGLLIDTGALGQGGLGFGRQSWVGLSDRKLGRLTFGRQNDFMFDSLVPYIHPSLTTGGYANNPLDNDRLAGVSRVNNSIKYVSPVMSGFSFGGLVSFSEAQNTVRGTGYVRSFGANYKNGAFNGGIAYTYAQGATLETRTLLGSSTSLLVGGLNNEVYGLGGTYQVSSQVLLNAVATASKYEGTTSASTAKFRNVEVGVLYSPRQQWRLGAALNTTKFRENNYRQVNFTADYVLSKRTDVYAQVIHQRASGAGATANIYILPASSNDAQTAFRVGIRHLF